MSELGTNFEKEDIGQGKIRHTQYINPIAFQRDGLMRRINSNFVQGSVDFPHLVSEAKFRTSVAPDGKRRLHPTGEMDRYFELGAPYVKVAGNWQKVNFANVTRQNNQLIATHQNAILRLTHGGHMLKMDIELLNGYIPTNNQVAFPVGLVGLTRSAGVVLADGVPVMRFQKPYVYDKNNETDTRPITVDYAQVASQWYVIYNLPDMTGMSAPVIDPTTTLQPDSAGYDSYIASSASTTNFGGNQNISIGDISGTSAAIRGVIKFDVSSIPSAAVVTGATLSLYESSATDTASLGSWSAELRRLLRNWVENQATWNIYSTGNSWTTAGAGSDGNDRSASNSATLTLDGTAALAFVDWTGATLTDDVQKFVNSTYSNYGWLLQAPTAEYQGTTPQAGNVFSSSDNTTAANRPKLTIDYTTTSIIPVVMAHRRSQGMS